MYVEYETIQHKYCTVMEFHLIDELQINSEESNMNNTNELSDALTKYCSDKQYSFRHIFTMWGGDEDVYARERGQWFRFTSGSMGR